MACAGSPTAAANTRWKSSKKNHAAPRSRCICATAKTSSPTVTGCAASFASISDHITLPIVMKEEEWDKDNSRYRTTGKDQTVNQASALWARSKNDITEEQYHEFYKHVAHDFEAPLAYTHNKVEGRKEYTQLLIYPGARAVRPVGPRAPARHQALCAARVHHGRCRAIAAGLFALRARRDRLGRPAAQRVARNPAGIEGHPGYPRPPTSSACCR